jgi:dipeptidyl aminopeptidase/acylaminoacyl peptidase
MIHLKHGLTATSRRALLGLILLGIGSGLDAPRAQQPLAAVTRDGVGAPDAAVSATLPHYLQSRSATFVDWLWDGSMLIATRFGDTEQIHRLRMPLGMREQLSYAPGGVAAAAARPYASDAFVYLEPHHGGDSGQLMLQRLADQSLTALTDGAHRDGPALWAHDGKRIAFASNRRNGSDVDIYVLDTGQPGGTPRLVVGGAGNHWRAYDWSLDDKRLLLGRELPGDGASVNSSAGAMPESELYIAGVDSGEITTVGEDSAAGAAGAGAGGAAGSGRKPAAHKAAAAAALRVQDARFSSDGRGVLLLTRHSASGGGASLAPEAQFQRLCFTDFGGHEWRELSADASHDVERFDRSIDGHYLAYVVNDNGSSRLMLIDQQRKLDLTVAALPSGVISTLKFDPSGQRLALTIATAHSPRDVYVLEPETQALTRWTQSELGLLDPASFVAPQVLRFPTWDRVDSQRRELTALVYRGGTEAATVPPAAPGSEARVDAGPRPVLLLLCGGGGGQCRPGFEPFLQYLIHQLGVVIVAPNVRGSTGFGRALAEAGQGALRDDALRDIGSLLVWIDLQRDLDRNRVAVLGEGYGAYLALQSLADYGDRLRGGIAAFPPQLAALANRSAIRRPLLLVQGLNNPAAPAYEMEQLRSRLRVDGVDVQYLAAADEAAGFTRKSNLDAYREAAASFLAQLLR